MIHLHPGAQVRHHGVRYAIARVLDPEQVLARDPSGRSVVLPILELGADDGASETIADPRPADQDVPTAQRVDRPERDLTEIDEARWRMALARARILAPLLARPERTRTDVAAVAAAVGAEDVRAATGGARASLHPATLYRWLAAYARTGTVSSLVPRFDGRGQRGSHLTPEVDAVVAGVLDALPRAHARRAAPPPTLAQVHAEVARLCAAAGLPTPHVNTVRRRAATRAEDLRRQRRERRTAVPAHRSHQPSAGQFPGADYPLAVVQIDHTPLDLACVADDAGRQPVGRPWLTVAIDVFSRMVLGWILGLDPPSAQRVGLCLAHAILPKERWLAAHGLTTRWPCWGRPRTVHADNAKEFRGDVLRRASEEYGIGLQWRPVARPAYGAHVERLLGVMLRQVHTLPGTTFSNPTARGDYDSRGSARLTVAEAERVLALWITGVYHERPHQGLDGDTPRARWEAGCLRGVGGRPPTGLPPREADERQLTLDFLPSVERTIQPDGVHVDHVRYYSDVLRPFMGAGRAGRRTYLFRTDRCDASRLYFRDPERQMYYEVPYADTRHPRVSGYDLQAAARQLRAQGRPIDEAALFATLREMQAEVEAAAQGTVQANRAAQRTRDHARSALPAAGPVASSGAAAAPAAPPPAARADCGASADAPPESTSPALARPVRPFEEIDDAPFGWPSAEAPSIQPTGRRRTRREP